MTFYGQWDPPVDKVLYENYFKYNNSGFFIEAGAYDGENLSCCKFFEDHGWKGINIEPAKIYYDKLVRNRPHATNLNIGLSDKEETLRFKNVIPKKGGAGGGNGSFEFGEDHLEELKGYGVDFDEYDVLTKPYSALISDFKVKQVDLMCLDVEGFEFRVLDGFKGADTLPSVMCIEYSYLGLKKLIEHMKQFNYVFDMISFNNAYFHHSSRVLYNKKWFGATAKECCVVDGRITWRDM